MRNFGWGLFSLFVAILVLVLTVQDDFVSKEKAVDYTVQTEAMPPSAIVPVDLTATPQAIGYFEFAYSNDATAGDGREVQTRLICPHRTDAAAFNWSAETEPTARSGPYSRLLMVVQSNRRLLNFKGAANLPLIV